MRVLVVSALTTILAGCGSDEDVAQPSTSIASESATTQTVATQPTTSAASLLDTVTTRSGPVREDIVDAIESIPVVVENHRACMELAVAGDIAPFDLKSECDFNNNFDGIFNTLNYVRTGLGEVAETANGDCFSAIEADAAQDGAGGFEAALEAHRDTYIVGYEGVSQTYQELERVAPLRVASMQAVITACG